MVTHTAQVRGRKIAWDVREVVQHGLNSDVIKLDLDAEWRECDRIQAVLAGAGEPVRILVEGGGFNLPSSLMERTGPVRMCLIGYVGETARIVTAKEAKPLTVVESGEMGGADPAPEQPDLWATLMKEVRKATEGAKTAAQSATRAEADLRAAAERGDFDGEDGKTPVRGVDYWTEADRKPIEDATLAATTAAGRADAAAEAATEGEVSRIAAEAERANAETARAKAEQAREGAETGRVEAEATRAANESERTESFNTNLVSWNSKVDAACKKATDTASKAAQDAKTATDAAIAQTQEATNAAVAKADKATASATTAANKAEAAVSKLPLPLGNTLKGEVESTMVSVHDAYPAPLVTTKVMGQSNQLTTTGKNLFNWDLYIGDYAFDTSASGQGFYYAKFQVGAGKTVAVSVDKVVTSGEYLAFADGKFGENKKAIWLAHSTVAVKNGTLTPDAEGNVWIWFGNSKQNIQRLYDTGVKVQVEIGTKATAYEPYTGGKPSPSPEYPQEITNLNKAELVISGKNLINADGAKKSGWNVLLPNTKLMNGATYVSTAPKCKQTCSIYAKASDTRLVGFIGSGKTERFTVTSNADFSKGCFIAGGSADSLEDMNTVINTVMVEVGTVASGYSAPKKYALTTIDLKGNELCSLPNGVKDEVVIDAEGNVSLIKRTKQYDWNCAQIIKGTGLNYAVDKVLDIGANYTGLVAEKAINAVNNTIGICYVNQKMIYVTVPESVTTKEQANQLYGGMKVIYQLAEPQTIPLGKVELPALPEATSNVWNDGNIPANVYIKYLKDVNIAFADLESKLTQAVVAAAANL